MRARPLQSLGTNQSNLCERGKLSRSHSAEFCTPTAAATRRSSASQESKWACTKRRARTRSGAPSSSPNRHHDLPTRRRSSLDELEIRQLARRDHFGTTYSDEIGPPTSPSAIRLIELRSPSELGRREAWRPSSDRVSRNKSPFGPIARIIERISRPSRVTGSSSQGGMRRPDMPTYEPYNYLSIHSDPLCPPWYLVRLRWE